MSSPLLTLSPLTPRPSLRRWAAPLRVALLCAACCVALCATTRAAADDPPPLAASVDDLSRDDKKAFRSLIDQCAKSYNAERFDDAERLCDQARALAPHPITRFTVARIRDRAGRCADAVTLYRHILDTPPPGASERKWLDEERAAIQKHLDNLGTCAPRVRATCDALTAPDALILIDALTVGRCGQALDAPAGAHTVTLLSPNRAPVAQPVTLAEGPPSPLTFASAPPAPPPSQPFTLPTTCQGFGGGVALLLDGAPVGVCPHTLDLSPGRHRVDALGEDGRRAAAVVRTDALPSSLTLSPLQPIALTCDDPTVSLSLPVPSLDEEVRGSCAEVAAAGPLLLPPGDYTAAVTRTHHDPQSVALRVAPDADNPPSLRVPALQPSPVAFSIACPPDLPAASIHIAGQTSACPLRASLLEGTYTAEVRADGHQPTTFPVTLSHAAPADLTAPAPTPLPFWTPGMITTLSGAAILTTGLIYDLATVSTLNDFKDLAANGQGPDDFARYNDLKGQVEDNILTTRILYGVGAGAAVVGGSLLLYEHLTRPPGDFSSVPPTTEPAASLIPSVTPLLAPPGSGTSAGLSLHWRY